MNSLRSAWTPFLAGRPILIRRRREKPKLEQPILSRDILSVGLVQNTGQAIGATGRPQPFRRDSEVQLPVMTDDNKVVPFPPPAGSSEPDPNCQAASAVDLEHREPEAGLRLLPRGDEAQSGASSRYTGGPQQTAKSAEAPQVTASVSFLRSSRAAPWISVRSGDL
jgi:hypothetical protein